MSAALKPRTSLLSEEEVEALQRVDLTHPIGFGEPTTFTKGLEANGLLEIVPIVVPGRARLHWQARLTPRGVRAIR